MSVWNKIKEQKEKLISQAKSSYNEYKTNRAEEKQLYKETYREARKDVIKAKAQAKAEKQRQEAIRDAQAGGKALRVAKDTFSALKKHRAERLKNKKPEVRFQSGMFRR